MMSSMWLVWFGVMALLLLTPICYGWGYRGWGPPYPSYVQRRRAQQAAATVRLEAYNHQAWGWRGDYVWMMIVIGLFWAATAFFWR